MRAGRLDLRVTFHRRADLGDYQRGEFEPFLSGEPAEYRRLSGAEAVEGGRLSDVEQGTLIIRDSAKAREITAADRVTIAGRDFAIKSVGVPVRRLRRIEMSVASELGG